MIRLPWPGRLRSKRRSAISAPGAPSAPPRPGARGRAGGDRGAVRQSPPGARHRLDGARARTIYPCTPVRASAKPLLRADWPVGSARTRIRPRAIRREPEHRRRVPSPVGHSIAGLIAYQVAPEIDGLARRQVIALYLFAANAPDLDFLPGLLVGDPNRFHHGVSHSGGLALLFAIAVSLILRRRSRRG